MALLTGCTSMHQHHGPERVYETAANQNVWHDWVTISGPAVEALSLRIAGLADEAPAAVSPEDYRNFAAELDSKWKALSADIISPLAHWRKKNLQKSLTDGVTIFYPFGGPDITYPLTLFPAAASYIAVGLELPGVPAEIERVTSSSRALQAFRTSLETFFERGYFITREMTTQMHSVHMRGVLPALLLQLKRLGNTIESISYGAMLGAPTGRFCQSETPYVRVAFRTQHGHKKTFTFVRCSLTDGHSTAFAPLCGLLEKEPFVTLIKSSSYLLHDPVFSKIRNFLLRGSRAILQDDTGVPYRLLKDRWNIKPFGVYVPPTQIEFVRNVQPDLQELYAMHRPSRLPFRFGYFSPNDSLPKRPANLLLAFPNSEAIESADATSLTQCIQKESTE